MMHMATAVMPISLLRAEHSTRTSVHTTNRAIWMSVNVLVCEMRYICFENLDLNVLVCEMRYAKNLDF